MIEARALRMRFGARVAVDGVTFKVQAGSVVAFLGPNGAGKSTTMRMLVGSLEPRAGSALICGEDMSRRRRLAQSNVGYLPESADGFPNLTVRELLLFCGESRGMRGRALRSRIGALCEAVDLRPALQTRLGELSKGWRQRAWFAQAILHDPPALVLDEPTDGLDPNQKELVYRLIRTMAHDKAILFSTHLLEEVEKVCTRALVIVAGSLVADEILPAPGAGRESLAALFRRLTANAPEDLERTA